MLYKTPIRPDKESVAFLVQVVSILSTPTLPLKVYCTNFAKIKDIRGKEVD